MRELLRAIDWSIMGWIVAIMLIGRSIGEIWVMDMQIQSMQKQIVKLTDRIEKLETDTAVNTGRVEGVIEYLKAHPK